jgi:hypothetical protein
VCGSERKRDRKREYGQVYLYQGYESKYNIADLKGMSPTKYFSVTQTRKTGYILFFG